ncbi:MAG: hypothetical protein IKZ87_05810, partial [Actinomycetaceae bacterium]|nr:hypothetical protein [Actinomycetaceae bacterium]
ICKGNQWIGNAEAIVFVERLDNVVKIHFKTGLFSQWAAESVEVAQNVMVTLEKFLLDDQAKRMTIGNN